MNKTHNTVDLSMIFNNIAPSTYIRTCTVLFLFFFACSSSAQEVISAGPGKEVIVLPQSYSVDSSYKDLGLIKTSRQSKNKKNGNFIAELGKIAAKTAKEGGNVFQITRIEDQKQRGRYRFWGEAYHTDKYSQLKASITDKKKNANNGSFAYLTIFRPAYSQGFNDDSVIYDVTINDTLKLEMKGNTRYILKITKEGNVKIEVRHKNFVQDMKVDVKMGNNYYVRSYVNFPGAHKYITTGEFKVKLRGYTPYLEKIDDQLQGEIESSMVTLITVTKKI